MAWNKGNSMNKSKTFLVKIHVSSKKLRLHKMIHLLLFWVAFCLCFLSLSWPLCSCLHFPNLCHWLCLILPNLPWWYHSLRYFQGSYVWRNSKSLVLPWAHKHIKFNVLKALFPFYMQYHNCRSLDLTSLLKRWQIEIRYLSHFLKTS